MPAIRSWSSGRVADRSVIAALGWGSGDRLTLTAESGVVIAGVIPAAWSRCHRALTS
jgi:hypothetical protein